MAAENVIGVLVCVLVYGQLQGPCISFGLPAPTGAALNPCASLPASGFCVFHVFTSQTQIWQEVAGLRAFLSQAPGRAPGS